MATDHASHQGSATAYGWRLKILLGLGALLLGLLVLSRLGLCQAKLLGPWGQSVYEVVNPPAVQELSLSDRNWWPRSRRSEAGEFDGDAPDSWDTSAAPTRSTSASTGQSSVTRISCACFPKHRQSHLGARPSQHKSHRRGAWTPERDVQP